MARSWPSRRAVNPAPEGCTKASMSRSVPPAGLLAPLDGTASFTVALRQALLSSMRVSFWCEIQTDARCSSASALTVRMATGKCTLSAPQVALWRVASNTIG